MMMLGFIFGAVFLNFVVMHSIYSIRKNYYYKLGYHAATIEFIEKTQPDLIQVLQRIAESRLKEVIHAYKLDVSIRQEHGLQLSPLSELKDCDLIDLPTMQFTIMVYPKQRFIALEKRMK